MPRNPYTGVHNPSPYSPAAPNPYIPSGGITSDMLPTVWDADPEPVTLPDGTTIGHTIHLEQFTTAVLRDTSVTTADRLYVPGGGPLVPSARVDPPNIRVEEVTLEVPVSHGKLTYALGAVDATIAARRHFGYTIPEESRTVTTIGNEIVIRWEEHS